MKRDIKKPTRFILIDKNKEKILLHKRDDNTSYSPNKWDYFGGGIEQGKKETNQELFTRELYEELGIYEKRKSYNGKTIDDVIFIDYPYYRTRELKLGEGAGFAWFSITELSDYRKFMTEQCWEIVNKFLKRFGWKA